MANIYRGAYAPDFGTSLGQAIGQGFQGGFNQGYQQQQLQRQKQQEGSILQNALRQAQGNPQSALQMVLSAPISPETKKLAVESLQNQMTLEAKQQELGNTQFQERQTREILSKNFGPDFAELYGQATEGGKTKLIQTAIEARQRGMDVNEILSPMKQDLEQNGELQPLQQMQPLQQSQQKPQAGIQLDKKSEISPEFNWPKISAPKGRTPKERVSSEIEREKTNRDFYDSATNKLKNLEEDMLATQQLVSLNESDGLPEGFGRLNLDPKTGQLQFPAAASPEAQLYVKTVNNFVKRAKDSYGARVTNFDLDNFMQGLPSLANTKEGRRLILKQMEIINQLNSLNEKSLIDTYDHYGVENLNYQKANQISKQLKAERENALKDRFKSLDNLLDKAKRERAQDKRTSKNLVVKKNPKYGEYEFPIDVWNNMTKEEREGWSD